MARIGPEQVGQWFDAYGQAMVLYARQWLDGSAAEDVVQEVLLSLFGRYRPPGDVKGWLFRSVRNRALNHLRSARRRQAHEETPAAARLPWFDPAEADRIDARAVEAALCALPPGEREIVVLRIWGGLTFKEIGETVGEPVSTVHDRYQAALAALRRSMRP